MFNTAIALGRLGVPVEFFSGMSTDLFGEQLSDALAASKVGLALRVKSRRGRRRSPSCISIDGHATYMFYDENTAGRMLYEADLPALGAEVEAMHFGCISLIPEPCGSTYEA